MKTISEDINRIKTIMGIITEDHGNMMTIYDVVDLITRMGFDSESVLEMFRRAFKHSGDDGVVEMFREFTGHHITTLGRGRYVMSHN